VWLEESGKLKKKKKSNDVIGTRNRDLPACSIVAQPTTQPRAIKIKEYVLMVAMLLFYLIKVR
jgi:hypothetical protein